MSDQFNSIVRDKSMNRCESDDDEFSCGQRMLKESVRDPGGDDK